MRSVENEECRKCGEWKMRNINANTNEIDFPFVVVEILYEF